MSATTLPRTSPLLAEGDRVVIRRNLSHPAWMHRIDGRDVGMMYLARTDLPELVGVSEVSATRNRTVFRVVDGELVKVAITEVQVHGSNFWFDAETGDQVNSGATHLTRIDG